MPNIDPAVAHLLRRAGFGISTADAKFWSNRTLASSIDRLINYEAVSDDVDGHIGDRGYLGITSKGGFRPSTELSDAQQR